MTRYEVVESRVWKRDDGRTASIYGALPWIGESEKSRWEMVTRGWTIRDNRENTVGLCRVPWKDEAECREYCANLNKKYEASISA